MTDIIKNESPKTINNAFRATGIDKFRNLEVESPDISVEENEQELILKFSPMMKSTQNVDDQPEILDDSELQIENECANYETKPDKKPSKKNHQQKLTSFFSKK